VQLPLEDHDLVSEGEDLGILGPIAHRQQSQHCQQPGWRVFEI
jgi:hypothetical protein